MKPLILITRPTEDADRLAELLRPRFETFSEPMLSIRATQEADALLHEAAALHPQALLATSRHALPLLFHEPELAGVPMYAVGHETAQAARRIGCAEVKHEPEIEALLALVMRRCSPDGGPLVYLRGREVSLDVAARLKRMGFQVRQQIMYEAEQAQDLSPALIALLERKECSAATFFSQRTAAAFMELAAKAHMIQALPRMHAVVISSKVAEPLGTGWKSIHVAQQPTLQGVVESVDKLAYGA